MTTGRKTDPHRASRRGWSLWGYQPYPRGNPAGGGGARKLVMRYGLAVLATAIATAVRFWLENAVGPMPMFITFYPAVLLTAVIAGGGPGILATLLCVAAADYWFIPPHGFGITAPNDLVGACIFLGMGLFMSVVAERMRRSRWAQAYAIAKEEEAQTLAAQNEELRRQGEELAQQSEELSQQAEEMAHQNEDLQSQSEEIQAQSEEIQAASAQLAQREDLLQSLLDATRKAAGEQAVLNDICRAGLAMFGAAATSVAVLEVQAGGAQLRSVVGAGEGNPPHESWDPGRSFLALIAKEGKTGALADTSLRPDLSIFRLAGQPPFAAVLCSPITVSDRVWGTVGIYSRQKQEWTQEQFRLAEWLAAQCSHIIEVLRLQQALAERARLLNLSYDAILVRDAQDRITYWNQGAVEAYGYAREEALGRISHELLRTEFPEPLESIVAALHREGRWSGELVHTRKDGSKIAVASRWAADRDVQGRISSILETNSDITARKRGEQALKENEARLRLAQQAARIGAFEWDIERGINTWTPELEKMYGLSVGQFGKTQTSWEQLIYPEDRAGALALVERTFQTGEPVEGQWRVQWPDGGIHWIFGRFQAFRNADGKPVRLTGVNIDVSDAKAEQAERETTNEFLKIVNQAAGTRELVQAAVTFLREQSGCEAVGIRLKEGEDYPYYEVHGFPEEFVRAENSLCEHDVNGQIQRDNFGNPCIACMCGNVICGRFDPSKPFFTAGGSFWANCTTGLLANSTDADRQAKTRNRCNGQGYESVALIPLRAGSQPLGLIQLNDKRKGMFNPRLIALWERLAGYLAAALAKLRAEEALRQWSVTLEQRVAERTAELAQAGAKIQGERQRLFDVLETLPAMICLLTPDYRVAFANRSFRERFGEAGGRRCYDQCFGRNEPCDFCESYKVLQTGQPHHWVVNSPDGSVIDAYDFPFTDADGSPMILEMDLDITERRRAEAAIREMTDTLEQRVAERTVELERSNRDLEQFAYVASHDLQEPLRQVTAFTGIIRDRYQNKLDESGRQYCNFVIEGSKRMQDLVKGLLEYSRIGTRGGNLQPVDSRAVVGEVMTSLSTSIEEAGAEIEVDHLPTVRADKVQLSQLFQNLLGNAIKFRSQAPPRIEVGAKRDSGDWLFWVKDNGIGLDEQYKEKIFVIFQRLHTRQAFPGTGIGLSICKKIVERHGGRIWVESRPGAGSTFFFTLPA